MIASVQWYRRPARSNDSQIRGHPSRMIIGEDGNSLARRHAVMREPTADGLHQSTQLGVGVALNAARLLDLDRNILRPALSAFDEAIVKSGHQCGKYTTRCNYLRGIIFDMPPRRVLLRRTGVRAKAKAILG